METLSDLKMIKSQQFWSRILVIPIFFFNRQLFFNFRRDSCLNLTISLGNAQINPRIIQKMLQNAENLKKIAKNVDKS